MILGPPLSHSDSLRRAIAWLAEQGGWSARRVEEACQRFDVTPADEDFLLRELRRQTAQDADERGQRSQPGRV